RPPARLRAVALRALAHLRRAARPPRAADPGTAPAPRARLRARARRRAGGVGRGTAAGDPRRPRVAGGPRAHAAGLVRDAPRGGGDAVGLATPPSRHHPMALAALRAGKHVWVEKPLALSTAQGGELVEAARQAARVLFVDETFLYDPLVREMKRIIDLGGLGEVCHLSFERLGMGRIKRDSNVWWNSAPHDLSILLYLVPRRVLHVRLHEH